MADDQRAVSVNRPVADWVPRSMRNSGTNLDETCPEIEQASAGSTESFDSAALRELKKEKS
jgi:hypothetical protein